MLHNFILLRAQIAVVITADLLIPTHKAYTTFLGFRLTPKGDQTSTFDAAGTDVKTLPLRLSLGE